MHGKRLKKLKAVAPPGLVQELVKLVEDYNTTPGGKFSLTNREQLRYYLGNCSSFIDFITGNNGNPEDYEPGFDYKYSWTHQRHLKCFFPNALEKVFRYLTSKCEKRYHKYYFKKNFSSFEELITTVRSLYPLKNTQTNLKGFGNLDSYDFSLRYAYSRSRNLLPKEYVYVDHGRTKDSAEMLYQLLPDFPEIIDGKIRFADCPDWLKEFKTLGRTFIMYSKDIENFLCHYYDKIEELFDKYK